MRYVRRRLACDLCGHARSLRSIPDRRAAHRRRPDGALQLAARARPGDGPDGGPGRSCCGSKIPTASDRPRRTSSRSSTRCAGWASTGTRARSSRSERRRAPPRGARRSCSPAGTPTTRTPPPTTCRAYKAAARRRPRLPRRRRRSPARSGCACPTRATPSFDDVIRGQIAFANASMDDSVIARADGSVLYNFAVAIDDLDAGITARRPRRGPHLRTRPSSCSCSRRSEPRRRATRTCRCCTAPTAEALQAPRRRVGPGAARGRLPARGGRQLHRAARRRLRRRRGVLHARRARRALPARARVEEPGGVRRAQAAPPQRRSTCGRSASTS